MSKVETIYLKDYKKSEFTVKTCDLVFELFEEHTQVTNLMSITKVDKNCKNLVLNSVDLELIEIYLNDAKLDESRYVIEKETLTVLDVGDEFKLIIINKIYPQLNSELEGLYKSGNIFCTQNEPEGFRRITPYIDRPDVMAVFKTTLVANKERYPILLSNGNRESNFRLDDGRHGITWFDPHPKPSYLFALVAGDLGVIEGKFITKSKKYVRMYIYTDKGNESKCKHAMKSLKEAMKWDEDVYGREYDLDLYNIVAVDSFNMGAMENKGLNIFNSTYVLADEDTATDANFMGIQSVIAHEYFHNWTGNRITCRDWFQLTLKEGLTVFRDQCFSADLNSKEVQRIEDVKALRERQFVEDSSPTAHPIQPNSYMAINNFYTATVYEKGAEIIRMIYTLLGEEKYRKATDLYFQTFDGQAVRTDDFLWAMSSAGGVDLKQFERWYHQSGTPKLKLDEKFSNSEYTLTLTQIVPNAVDGSAQKPYFFPLKTALLDESGKEIEEKTIIVSKETEEFVFKTSTKPILSINRDFSAPIIIEQTHNNYAFLMKHDKNSFVKYESAQSFGVETIEAMMRGEEIDEEFVKSYGHILDSEIDLSYKALLLELPSVLAIMQREEVVDFEPIYEAKEKLQKHLALTFKEKLLEIYTQNHKPASKELDAKSIGERSIKNRCLKLLSALESDEVIMMANAQYNGSITMTDRVAALDILENSSPEFSAVALENFYKKYKDDTLVMNKYFSILAASHRDGTLDRVMALQNDDAYNELVPNLVRSLIGVFARNYKHFHAKDGLGYRFVVDKMIDIDKINPQMASGLAGAFKIYEKLNSVNKKLMKTELDRVVSEPSISKNVYEIVSKILKID
ncbi:MAG: aminopeptidase N [Sulfurimonas sp. RIFCSPLOWO2_12_FULL_36_74]|uniref:aminopeptidase N n=1 Tax=Sulfurimonas sp. RIFCSPLOWO2_12_36_12 TaxID=1802253 RepID=UPI0008B3E4BB|nr:aminopeptidase N [Sulfurimonas sp. RIFCSPLOWO2_12_36_12]OHD97696.1 MAG: aminopeptidase N [Sulfurimonas sp. RIFCSPLOWO2_02_FULL_36_28]OHE02195.1 MAG: aminopeptidase N [Sulfurimonas sp. RIFCSPLOWO2_12_36_12]OHE02773.1 MAG: aminopeptidase N [Sulfurimonas sp. RIFCSPLOWO2_12_FULL_36_74]